MPLIHVLLTHNAYDDVSKARFAKDLTDAACRAESVPDLPIPRSRALILMEELPPGGFYSDAKPADDRIRGVFLTWKVLAGVLDGARKARFATDLQAAAENAAPSDSRMVVTSAVIEEVPEGQWAQTGSIRRLPEVASIAGFEHLVSIAATQGKSS